MIKELGINYCDEIPDVLEDGILYVSKKYSTAIHLCACGCKNQTVTPLFPNVGSGWNFSDINGLVTLRPSIGNWYFPCRSHYWITNNQIIKA